MLTAIADDGTDTMVFSTDEDKKTKPDKVYYKCCGLKDDGSKCDDKVFLKRCEADRYRITSFFSHCKNSSCSESKKLKKNIDNEYLMKWTLLLRIGKLKNKYWITNGEECVFNDNYNIFILKKLPSLDFFLVNNTKKRTVYILDFSTLKNNNIVRKGDEYFIRQDLFINITEKRKRYIVDINPEAIDFKNVDIYIDKLDNLLYKVSLKDIYYDKEDISYLKLSIVSLSRELTRFGDLFNNNNYNFEKIIEDTTEYLINDILTNEITPEPKEDFDENVRIVNSIKKSFTSINQKNEELMMTKYTKEDLDVIIKAYKNVNIPYFKNNFLYKFLKNYINDKIANIFLRRTELYYEDINNENISIMKDIESLVLKNCENPLTFYKYIELIIDITNQIKNIANNNIILLKGGYIQCKSIKEVKKAEIKIIEEDIITCLLNYLKRIDNVLDKIDNITTTFYINNIKQLHFLKNIQDTVKLSKKLKQISDYKTYYFSKKTTKLIILLDNIASYYRPSRPNLKINNEEVIHHYKEFFCISINFNTTEPIPFQDIFFESEYKNKYRLQELGCKWNADTYNYSYNTAFSENAILEIKLMIYRRIYFESEYKYRDALKKLGCFYDFKKKLSYYPNTFNENTIKLIKKYKTTYK